jgi:transposase
MSRGRISMRKIREILRLKWECQCSNHLIACSVGVSSSTVSECIRRATAAHLSWPLPEGITEEELSAALYPPAKKINAEERGIIDWAKIHEELKRKHVTQMLLWQEYKAEYPQGISYSRFCDCYRVWTKELEVWMRQTHKLGEKCFVDYAGMKMPIVINETTGEIREAEIFVGVLGASNYIYTEATWTQRLPDWIGSHVKMFEFYGGVPELIIPDNLKSGVSKAHYYEPDLNPTYQDMAQHYNVVILPTRVRSPKDKAKVENAVQQVERQILAKLRDRTFFSLSGLNIAIIDLLTELNCRPFQKLSGSRFTQFVGVEQPTLKPLPLTCYIFSEWKKARAGADYHIELEEHYYSVPYTYIKKELDARYTKRTIEIFYKGKCIASHARSYEKHRHTTCKEHMPKHHQLYAEWTPERMIRWASKTGMATAILVERIMASRAHPQQGFRSCLGILSLSKRYGHERLESACQRAIDIGASTYKSIESILKNGLDKKSLPQKNNTLSLPANHEYVRGREYFE